MSGIVVDVNTNSANSEKKVAELNKGLLKLLENAKFTKRQLNDTTANDLVKVNKNLLSTVQNFRAYGNVGVKASADVSKGVATTTGAFGGLQRAIAGVVTAMLAIKGIGTFNKVADDLTNIQNRLKLVSDTMDDVVRAQTRLYKISKETRSELAGTADIFVDFSKALETLSVAPERIYSVVKTIQQAGKLSGSSTESIRAALLQLNQGIASGTLRGEELNSVMEQMKYLGIGLQQSFKMNAGELRKFAEQGGITTTSFLEAVESMASKTDKDFKKMSSTVENSFNRLGQAVKYMLADFNQMNGFSTGFAKRLRGVAEGVDLFNENLRAGIFILRENVNNYFKSLDLFDALSLTVRAAVKLEVSPLDLYDTYKKYDMVKDQIDRVQKLFGFVKSKPLKVPLKTEVSTDTASAEYDPTELEMKIDRVKTAVSSLGQIAYEVVRGVQVTITNLIALLPRIAPPAVGLFAEIRSLVWVFMADLGRGVNDVLMPFVRELEAIDEMLGGFLEADNRTARAWVKMFDSSSIEEFAERLKDLNDARLTMRMDRPGYLFSEAKKMTYEFIRPLEKLLQTLDLIDNSFFAIKYSNLDRLKYYLISIGSVSRRVYQDIFATTVEPLVIRLLAQVAMYGDAVADAFLDIFNESVGERVGRAFGEVLTAASDAFGRAINRLMGRSGVLEDVMQASMFDSFIAGSTTALNAFFSFVKGLVKGVGQQIDLSLSAEAFKELFRRLKLAAASQLKELLSSVAGSLDKLSVYLSDLVFEYKLDFDKSAFEEAIAFVVGMFETIVSYAASKLKLASDSIDTFGGHVKSVFYDMWDAVVGHSYWPDLIDGVVSYTDKLFDAMPSIETFGQRVKGLFKSIYAYVVSNSGVFGQSLEKFVERVRATDWDMVLHGLVGSLGATIASVLFMTFGSNRLKIAAVGYFFSVFNGALNGAFSAFFPAAAYTIGTAFGDLIQHAIVGVLKNVDLLIAAVPAFWDSLLDSFSPLLNSIVEFLSYLPVVGYFFGNTLITAIATAGAALAVFSKDARKMLGSIVFGKDVTKKVKKGNKTHQDGLLDFVKAGVGYKGSTGPSLIEDIFPLQHMAALAGVAFSTALFESVSLLEASMVGIPLLLFAVLGKDGGGKVLRQVGVAAEMLAVGLYTRFADAIRLRAGKDSILSKVVDAPIDLANWFTSGQKSSLSSAFSDLTAATRQLFVNYRKNADKFALGSGVAGGMSFLDAILTGQTDSNGKWTPKTLEYKKIFTDFAKEIGTIKVGKSSIGEYFSSFSSAIYSGYQDVKAGYKKADILGMLKSEGQEVFTALKGASADILGLMTAGLLAIGKLLRNKFVLFGILAAGFSATAFAAADATTAVTSLADVVLSLGKALLIVAAPIALLGGLVKIAGTFNAARDAFIENSLGKNLAEEEAKSLAEAQAAFKQNFAKNAKVRKQSFEKDLEERLTTFRSFRQKALEDGLDNPDAPAQRKFINKTLDAEVLRERLKAQKDFTRQENAALAAQAAIASRAEKDRQKKRRESLRRDVPGANKAGFAAVGNLLKTEGAKLVGRAKTVGLGIAAVLASPFTLFNAISGAGTKLSEYSKSVFQTQRASLLAASATASLGAAMAALKVGAFTTAFTQLSAAIRSAAASIGLLSAGSLIFSVQSTVTAVGAVTGVFAKFMSGILKAATVVGKVLSKLGALLWPLIKVPLLIASAVAVVGAVGLWLFGPGDSFFENLEWAYDKIRSLFGLTPKSKIGKQGAVTDSFAPASIGGLSADFGADLSRIDFEKLSDVQVKVLSELGKTTKESFDLIAEEYARQGFLTQEQRQKFANIENDVRQVLLRQPTKAVDSFADRTRSFVVQMLEVDNSLWAIVKRMVGYEAVLTREGKKEPELSNFGKFWDTYVDQWQVAAGAGIGAILGGFIGLAGGVPGFVAGATKGGVAGAAIGAGANAADEAAKALGFEDLFKSDILEKASWRFRTFLSKFRKDVRLLGDYASSYNGLPNFARFAAMAPALYDAGKAQIGRGYEAVKKRYSVTPSQKTIDEASRVLIESELLDKYQDFLPSQLQQVISDSKFSFEDAQLKRDKLLRRGYRASEDKNEDSFFKELAAAEERVKVASEQYFSYAKTYGALAFEESKIFAFNQEMQELASAANTLLDLNKGKFFEDFIGDDKDLARLKELIAQMRVLDIQKNQVKGGRGPYRATNQETRRVLTIQEQNLKRRAQEDEASANARARFSSGIEETTKQLGIGVSALDLQKLSISAPGAFKRVSEIGEEIRLVKQDITDLIANDGAPAIIAAKYAEVARLQSEAISNTFTKTDFSQLISRAQTVGLEGLDSKKLLGFDEAALGSLGYIIDKLRDGQNTLLRLEANNAGLEDRVKAQKDLVLYQSMYNKLLAEQAAKQATAAKNNPALTAADRLLMLMRDGVQMPSVASTSESGINKFNELQARRSAAESDLAKLQQDSAEGRSVKTTDLIAVQQKLLEIDTALQRLEERVEFTVDSLISTVGESGLELSKSALLGLDDKTLSRLSAAGRELEDIRKLQSQTTATGLTGAALDGMLTREQAAIDRITDLVKPLMLRTGSGIASIFEEVGASSVTAIRNMSVDNIKTLQDSYFAVLREQRRMEGRMNLSQAIASMKRRSDEQLKQKRLVEDASTSVDSSLSGVNQQFGTDLSGLEFSAMGDKMVTTLSRAATAVSRALEDAIATGASAGTAAFSSVYEAVEKLKRSGALLTFFTDIRRELGNAMFEGAKSGFDRLKSVLPNTMAEFGDYTALSGSQRRAMSADATRLQLVERASNMQRMTPQIAEVLERLSGDAGLDTIVAELEKATLEGLGKTLEEALASPMEYQNILTEKVVEELRALRKIASGESPVTVAKASQSATSVDLSPAAFRGIERRRQQQAAALDRGIASSSLRRDILRRSNGAIDESAVNLASGERLGRIDVLSKGLYEARAKLASASEASKPALQNAIDFYETELSRIADIIRNSADGVKLAGEGFAGKVKGDFKTALSGLLKGETDEGKSVFQTFVSRIIDNMTSSVIDTLSQSLTDSLFGENSFLKDIGSNLAVLGQDIGKSLFDSFSNIDFGSLWTRLTDSFASIDFSAITSVLQQGFKFVMSFLGFADGGYVSGPGTGTSDSIPAMLSNGEFVINSKATKAFGPLLHAINSGNFSKFSDGGLVSSSLVAVPAGPSAVTRGSSSQGGTQVVHLTITGDISRQTRAQIYEMLPSIADGVNGYNREKGYKG